MLLITPFILKTIGTEQYGIWALAGVVTSYAQLSDFGIGESVVKFAAEYYAVRDSERLNRLANTVLVTYLVLACLFGGGLLLVLPLVASDLLHIPLHLLPEAVLIFRLAVVIFTVNMVAGVFAALVTATQQIGYTTAVSIASTLLGVAGAVYFLTHGFGLIGLIATNALVALFVAVLSCITACRLYPTLRLNPFRWVDRAMFRQIFGYSWKVQISNFSQLLIFQIDRILLSRYLGLEAVAFYEIGSSFALYARTFVLTLFSPMLPTVSELHVRNEHVFLAGLYRRSMKFMVMISIPFGLLVIGLAHPFIRIWMGEGFGLAATTLQLLLPVYLVHVLTSPGTYILNGINRPEIAMRGAALAGIANLCFCYFLVKSAGYFGLITGITLSLSLASGYLFLMIHQSLPELDARFYREIFLRPLIFSVPAAVALHFFFSIWSITGILPLILAVGIYLGGAVLITLRGNYLDDFERQVLSGMFSLRRQVR